MYRQRERKLAEITVPPIDQMFYRDPAIIIRNFDYVNDLSMVGISKFNTKTSTTIIGGNLDEALLRISAPSSKFQNNPPKTREEVRKEKKLKEIQDAIKTSESELPTQGPPKVIKKLPPKPVNIEDTKIESAEQTFGAKKLLASNRIIGGAGNAKESSIFNSNDSPQTNHKITKTGKIELEEEKSNKDSLSPHKSSRYNLNSGQVPGIFTRSDYANTASQRSLFKSASRNDDIDMVDVRKQLITSEIESEVEKQEEFSNFLFSAAKNKPTFMNRSSKRQLQVSVLQYEHHYEPSGGAPPMLPPRDYIEKEEHKATLSIDSTGMMYKPGTDIHMSKSC